MTPARLALVALAIAATATAAAALDFTRIRSERAFRDFVADRTLVDEFGGTLVFAANGGVGGTKDRHRVSGGWRWTNEALCHATRLDGIVVEQDCKHLYILGDMVVMRAKEGRSSQETWRLR
ncbi:hypothetical protein [Jannaschia sp. W003]|uniref:hypothetical protein n=1 Tax=Jannaschia sp. W003 TaxID=2867012 RepID=UPI0021A61F68|nr:hypothetical protein [Jannaschia sp. W003]UWQ20354.1 hypothetical protein K3554_10130 [Jannaschia sp. W003]